VRNVIAPSTGADSEALLATPQLGAHLGDFAGKRIAILRGDGGRALLGDTFVARGAEVEYITCYRRLLPQPPAKPWKTGDLAAVTVSSSQGLENLFEVLDPAMLRATPLFVPHPRIADRARALEVREVVLAGHSDAQMLEGLMAYFQTHG
jgi:uroporphyrinogen-III synthase